MVGVERIDPIEKRRRRVVKIGNLAWRIGWLAIAVMCVAFVAGYFSEFPRWSRSTVAICVLVSAIALPGGLVLRTGVKLAEKDERKLSGAAKQ